MPENIHQLAQITLAASKLEKTQKWRWPQVHSVPSHLPTVGKPAIDSGRGGTAFFGCVDVRGCASGYMATRRTESFPAGANIRPLDSVTAAAALSGRIIFLHTFERNDSFVFTGSGGGTLFQLRKLFQFGGPRDPTVCKYTSCDFARFIDRFSKGAYSRLIES
jgi:hypothetical protein